MRSPARALLAAVGSAIAFALPAPGFVPKPERIAEATAKANRAGSRTQALQVELTLRVADRGPIGSGNLVTHPNGLARLELRDARSNVERHLLVGSELRASRDGKSLERPRAFLPPLFFLQADSPMTLRLALAEFGLDVEAVALAPCGKDICYVLGDPARVPPPRPEEDPKRQEKVKRPATDSARGEVGAEERELRRTLAEAYGIDEEALAGLEEGAVGESPHEPERNAREERRERSPDDPPVPVVWIDTQTFEMRRMESRGGVVVDFGPLAQFGEVRFPRWVEIREPQRDPVRLDIIAVTPVNAPAAGFQPAWLLSPSEPRAGASRGRSVPASSGEPSGR